LADIEGLARRSNEDVRHGRHAGFAGRCMQRTPDPVLDMDPTLEEIERLSQLRTEHDQYGEVAFGIAPIWQT
jgi:hypothetical protein